MGAKVSAAGASGGGGLPVPANAFIREDGAVAAPPFGGVTVSGTPSVGDVPTATGPATATWQPGGDTAAINVQTGTTYTLQASDQGSIVVINNADAVTVTVPPDSAVDFPVGALIEVCQLGAGQVTIAPGDGVTINSAAGNLAIAAQYVTVGLWKLSADTWVANGNLS